ncbi:MAG: nuclear transport factor 2 family protein [Tateyamaria sp.]
MGIFEQEQKQIAFWGSTQKGTNMRTPIFALAGLLLATEATAQDSVEARLTAIEDARAVAQLATCYGRANDILFTQRHRAGADTARAEGIAKLSECFTDDAAFDVVFFNSPDSFAEPNGPAEWAELIIGFGTQNNVTSTRHLMGNIDVTISGDTAELSAFSVTPHFQASQLDAPMPSNMLLTGVYSGTAERTADGWRLSNWTVGVDDFQAVVGMYPFGFHPGTN